MPEEGENGIVTQVRLIQQSINALASKADEHHNDICKLISDHETRIRLLETSATEMKARQTNLAVIQGVFTAIGSTVAAVFGKMT